MFPAFGEKFSVVYADPPWNQKTYSDKGKAGRPQHYDRMSLEDIMAMPVADIAAKDSWLFLWTTWQHMPQALAVMEAWGFQYSSAAFVWLKLKKSRSLQPVLGCGKGRFVVVDQAVHMNDIFMGMGYTTRKSTEVCLLGRRSKAVRVSKGEMDIHISAVREHSRKPEEFYDRIERFAKGPYIELFARTARPGWTSWGNQVDKFSVYPPVLNDQAEKVFDDCLKDRVLPWSVCMRLRWIFERKEPFRRKDLMEAFGISKPQASNDIKLFKSFGVAFLVYNTRKKHYERH